MRVGARRPSLSASAILRRRRPPLNTREPSTGRWEKQCRVADVSDAETVDAAFREIESAFGPVTILVNNAGITRGRLVVRMSDEQWGAVIDTNLTGAFQTIRRATPARMKARYGAS